ncbi:hypothetical protein Tco_1147047 [Tanacetum coccineum]
MESSDQFICFFCGSLSDEYGCPCSTCELCGNDAHYGYDCPSQVPFVYNQDPCFNQNLDNFPQTSPSFPQQYLCCEDCGGPHATFECQPMNHSTFSGFDQFQPPQYPVIQPRQEISREMLLAKEKLIKAIQTYLENNNQPPEEKSIVVLLAEKSILTVMQTLEEKQNNTESMQELLLQLSKDLQTLGNTLNQLNQEEQDNLITPDLPITDSLVMEDEHLDTILETDSDEEIESSVENLNLTPSKSKDLSDYVSECDLPFCDNSPDFNNDSEIFSNPLFDSNANYTSSDDESSSDEDSDLIESLLNKDTVITSPKIDFLLEEFTGELALINPIPPRIAEPKFDPKEDIRLIKKLLYDNSSPQPPKELNSKISDAIIESFSLFPILDLDFTLSTDFSGSDLVVSFPSRNRNKTFDPRISIEVQSKRFLSLNKFSISFINNPLSPVLETLLPFSSKIEDKVFNPRILVSKEEKGHHLLSHRGFKAFKIIPNFLNESPMTIYGWDIPI